jgi:hypothetical protein
MKAAVVRNNKLAFFSMSLTVRARKVAEKSLLTLIVDMLAVVVHF